MSEANFLRYVPEREPFSMVTATSVGRPKHIFTGEYLSPETPASRV